MQLPSIYEAPGFVLLAQQNGQRSGCVAVRDIGTGIGEVRRLFVRPEFRSTRLGRQLVDELMTRSAASGFTRLVLSTLPSMTAAVSLYRSMGFQPIACYAGEAQEGVEYYGLDLVVSQ